MYRNIRFAASLLAIAVAFPAGAESGETYAQWLVEHTLARHPELNALTFHVKPKGSADNIIIASNMAPYGKKADEDDLSVLRTGQPLQEVAKSKDRYGVELPLANAQGRVIGVLALGFVYRPGQETEGFLAKAEAIRDELARQILRKGQLVSPMGPGDTPPTLADTRPDDDEGQSFIDSNAETALGVTAQQAPMSDENFSGAFEKTTGAVTPEDSYKYTTGLSKAGTTGYDLNLRGFTTTASDRGAIITDGLPGATVRYGAPPNAAVDHVEVIKGPAAVLYGAGQPGGFVNIVTKKPEADEKMEVSFSGRTTPENDPPTKGGGLTLNHGGVLGSADVNMPLTDDKTLLARVIFYGADQNRFHDFSYDHQVFIKPMLAWRPDADDEVHLSVENREDWSDDWEGLVAPKNNIKLVTRRLETAYQNPGDFITESGTAVAAGGSHSFAGGGEVTVDFRNVHHVDDSTGFDNARVQGDYQTLSRLLARKQNIRDYSFVNANLMLPFQTGAIGHQVVVGLTAGRDFLDTTRYQYDSGNASENISLYNPFTGPFNYGTALAPSAYPLCGIGKPGTVNGNACNKSLITQATDQRTAGLRVSDMVSLTEQWKVLLALRYDRDLDHFLQAAIHPIAGTQAPSTYQHYDIHQYLPMTSLIYEPIQDHLNIYATYSTGFVPAGGNNNDIHGNPLTEPATARSEEVGAKANLADGGLVATAALFNIQKEKTPVAVNCSLDAPLGLICFAPSSTHSKGFELQGDVRLAANWHLIAGYSLTDAHIVASPDPLSDGARSTNTPRHNLHLWSRYDIPSGPLKGFGVGVGEALVDWRAGTLPTTPTKCSATNGDACFNNVALKVPGYGVTDLAFYYKADPIDVTLKIGNLFDRGYFEAANGGSNLKVIPGEPRNFLLTTHLRF